MTLCQFLDQARLSDLNRELLVSVNGEEAVPVRGIARDDGDEAVAARIILTNEEDPQYG